MDGHTDNVYFFFIGAGMLLFNKQLGELTRQYGKAVFGGDSGTWSNRIGFIIAGVIFISFSVANW